MGSMVSALVLKRLISGIGYSVVSGWKGHLGTTVFFLLSRGLHMYLGIERTMGYGHDS